MVPLVAAATFFFLLGVALCFYTLPLIVHVLTWLVPTHVLPFLPNGDDS